jgi:hypothetical protein
VGCARGALASLSLVCSVIQLFLHNVSWLLPLEDHVKIQPGIEPQHLDYLPQRHVWRVEPDLELAPGMDDVEIALARYSIAVLVAVTLYRAP